MPVETCTVRIEHNVGDVYCPVCGAPILKDGQPVSKPCQHLVFVYYGLDCPEFSCVASPYRKLARQALAAARVPKGEWGELKDAADAGEDVGQVTAVDTVPHAEADHNDPLQYVLRRLNSATIGCLNLSVWGMACGPCGGTVAIAIDFRPPRS
ncbi:MAG: hypothetical protein ABSF26_19815 [Thermoguttaceae bacterium]|jgi:hypothetical protein